MPASLSRHASLALALPLALGAALAPRPAAADDTPTALRQVAEALAPRHAPASCAEAAAGLADPGPTFVALAERDGVAPWVAVRAARCAVATLGTNPGAATRPAVEGWLGDPDRAGLAQIVATALPSLPEATAEALAAKAAAGPLSATLHPLIAADPRPAVRAQVEAAAGPGR